MDETRRYGAMWNKSNREKQIVCDFTYMWNLKSKTNDTQNKTETVIYTEKKQMAAGVGGDG